MYKSIYIYPYKYVYNHNCIDEDMEELEDTLTRCAKLEVRKRNALVREAQLVAKHDYERKQHQIAQDSMYKYDAIEEEEEDTETVQTPREVFTYLCYVLRLIF